MHLQAIRGNGTCWLCIILFQTRYRIIGALVVRWCGMLMLVKWSSLTNLYRCNSFSHRKGMTHYWLKRDHFSLLFYQNINNIYKIYINICVYLFYSMIQYDSDCRNDISTFSFSHTRLFTSWSYSKRRNTSKLEIRETRSRTHYSEYRDMNLSARI